MPRHRETRSIIRKLIVGLGLLLMLAIGGCGKPGQISGKVKYKGKPVPTGKVVFFNANDRQVGTASINEDGSYSATVPSGTLRLAVITPASSETLRTYPKAKQKVILEGIKKMKKGAFNPLEGESKDSIPVKVVTVPSQYANPSSSGLTLEVLGGPQSYDIDLQ